MMGTNSLNFDTPSPEVPKREMAEHAHRRFKLEFEESAFDAIVAISPENVLYLSGAWIETQRLIRDRLAIVVWTGDHPVLLVDINEESFCRDTSEILDVRSYREQKETPIAALSDLLRERGLERGNIGIETRYLSAEHMAELSAAMPNARLGSCEMLFDEARKVKSRTEIDILAKASIATEEALLSTFVGTEVGESERSIGQRFGSSLLSLGADRIGFMFLPTGSSTGYAHPALTDYRVKEGDLIKADVGGVFSGYFSDRARTTVVGEPKREQIDMYSRLVGAHRETIAAIHPGVAACEVYETALRLYDTYSIPFHPPHAGHGIGLAPHEPPMLSPKYTTELVEGMVLAVETRVRVPGEFGMHIEDLVEITGTGVSVHLNQFPYDRLTGTNG